MIRSAKYTRPAAHLSADIHLLSFFSLKMPNFQVLSYLREQSQYLLGKKAKLPGCSTEEWQEHWSTYSRDGTLLMSHLPSVRSNHLLLSLPYPELKFLDSATTCFTFQIWHQEAGSLSTGASFSHSRTTVL